MRNKHAGKGEDPLKLIKNTWKHKTLFLMAFPAVLLLIAFNYVPMAGLVVAFKNSTMPTGSSKARGTDWRISGICSWSEIRRGD